VTTSLLETVQQIADAETQVANVAQSLLQLQQLGALTPIDVQRYNVLRIQLLGAQFTAYAQILSIARTVPGGTALLNQIPVPQMAPALPVAPNYFPALAAPTVAGLGNPIIIAVGGVTMTFPIWALVVVVIIVAVAAVAAFAAVVQLVTASEQIDANAQATATYYATVLRAVQDCRRSGGTVDACARLAASVQTPQHVMPVGPQTTPPGGDWTEAAKWLALGTVGIFGAILVSWTIVRAGGSSGSSSSSSGSRPAPRYYLQEG
jgi:hypothetical protein